MAVVGSLLFGTMACGGDEDRDGTAEVAGKQLCGGEVVSAEASRALELITGSSKFEASGKRSTVRRAAEDLAEAFPIPSVARKDICRIFGVGGTPGTSLRISWRVADGLPSDPSRPEATVLDMGERTVAQVDSAYVQFACRSDRLSRSSRVGRISISVWHRNKRPEPEGDLETVKRAYVTVAHSFALAMAKELGCEKNGGLPERPVLDPAQPSA